MESGDAGSRSVIIVGASADRSRFSNKAVRAYLEEGFQVYPVHPKERMIEGLSVWPAVSAVPDPAALLLLYVRPEAGMAAVEQAAAKGVRRIFVNPGTESPELLRRIKELGLEPIEACAIRALGRSPDEFPA